MNKSYIHLYDYNVWANGRLLSHLKSLPDEIFTKEANLGFKSIAEVIGHLANADEVWFTRIKGGIPPAVTPKVFGNLEEADQTLNRLQTQFQELLSTVHDFEQTIIYRTSKGEEHQNTVAEILRHVVNHGTYHRGNITTILRVFGFPGAQTDYIIYRRK